MNLELFLNLLWIATGAITLAAMPRRSPRTLLALVGVLALLFPIVSVSDDLAGDRDSFEEVLAIIVAVVLMLTALALIARVEVAHVRIAGVTVRPSSDPRSPPGR